MDQEQTESYWLCSSSTMQTNIRFWLVTVTSKIRLKNRQTSEEKGIHKEFLLQVTGFGENSYFLMLLCTWTGCLESLCNLHPFLELLRPECLKPSATTADLALSRGWTEWSPEVFSKLNYPMPLFCCILSRIISQDFSAASSRYHMHIPEISFMIYMYVN